MVGQKNNFQFGQPHTLPALNPNVGLGNKDNHQRYFDRVATTSTILAFLPMDLKYRTDMGDKDLTILFLMLKSPFSSHCRLRDVINVKSVKDTEHKKSVKLR